MTSASRPSQDRSRARREALLRAVIGLFADGGARAVTARAAAARAGVPLAATTYYFDSIQQLTEEALRLHVEERVIELRELALAAAENAPTANSIAERLVEALTNRDPGANVAQFEIYLEAARNPALREPVADALHAFEDLARTMLTLLGARKPDQAAAAFVALTNGFALNHLARPTDADAANLLEALRSLFLVQVMTDAQLAPLRRRLQRPVGRQPDVS